MSLFPKKVEYPFKGEGWHFCIRFANIKNASKVGQIDPNCPNGN